MAIYIALLRGINVGGKNKIKMADLKRALEESGLKRVQTYIQSGNILFESEEKEEDLRRAIEQVIEKSFGISLTVVLRTMEEWKRIIAGCPFSKEEIAEAESSSETASLYVALLPEAPSPEGVAKLEPYRNDSEEFRTADREVYLLFRGSVRNSKLAAQLPKLGIPSTVRNWNTMAKLDELADALAASPNPLLSGRMILTQNISNE